MRNEVTRDQQPSIDTPYLEDEGRVPQRGTWGENEEWVYFLHGCGCRLENRHTRESINWDCPNVKSFDVFFFLEHLGWQLRSPDRKNQLTHTQMWIERDGKKSIKELIEEMKREGLIEERRINTRLEHTLKDK